MNRTFARWLLWSPRVLGVAVSIFIGLFALDAFSGGTPTTAAVAAFVVHLLPAIALLSIVAVAWRRAWVGGLTFVTLAAVYAVVMARGRLDWVLVISGPLFMTGILFLWSWWHHRELRRRPG